MHGGQTGENQIQMCWLGSWIWNWSWIWCLALLTPAWLVGVSGRRGRTIWGLAFLGERVPTYRSDGSTMMRRGA